jgi:hypothetical protein
MNTDVNSEYLFQADEAVRRRQSIGEKYQITEQETAEQKLKLKHALEELSDSPRLEQVVLMLDNLFEGEANRQQEFKQLLVDSMVGKVSESIRHFLPQESQADLKVLLDDISGQLNSKTRKFNSFQDIYAELKQHKEIFDKHHVSEEFVAEHYIKELKEHLAKVVE